MTLQDYGRSIYVHPREIWGDEWEAIVEMFKKPLATRFAIVGMTTATPVQMEGGAPLRKDHGDHSPRSS